MKSNAMEISFYKLTTLPINKAAPRLIEKIYYSKQRLLVVAESEELMRSLDDGLWAYSTKHFIPHATFSDEYPADQPVYLSTKIENPNESSIAMALGKVELDDAPVSKLLYMFDGNIPEQVAFARKKWKSYQNSNHSLVFWQQNLKGAWEKQA